MTQVKAGVPQTSSVIVEPENRMEWLMNRISDGFLSLDRNLNYIYANQKAGEMIGVAPAHLIGRHVLDVFPDAVDTEMYHAIRKALTTQAYVCNTDYYAPLGLWQENHIYPTPQGLDIFIKSLGDYQQIQAAILSSKKMYRNLSDNLLHGFAYCKVIFENDKAIDYLYLSVNAAYESLTGLKNTTGKRVSEVMPGLLESDPLYFELITRVALSGVSETFETFAAPLGKWFSITLYCPQKGCFIGLVDDITEKKKFAEQQSLLASIVNSSKDAIISKDLSGITTSWNRGAEKLFGYTAQEVIGNTMSELIPEHLPNEEKEIFEKIKRGEHIEHYDTLRLRKDGKPIFISLSVSPIWDATGKIVGASKIARDITEKRIAEEKLRYSETNLHTIIENCTEAFVLTDTDFLIKAFNTKARKSILLQYGQSQALQGHCFLDHVHPDRRKPIRQVLLHVLKGETVQFEIDFYKKNNDTLWFQATFSPVKENGVVTGICIAAKDITEQKSNECKIRQSEENLRAILENTVQGFILLAVDGTIKSFNHNAVKYGFAAYGKTMQIGKSIFTFIEDLRIGFLKEAFARAQKGETVQYSRSYERSSGKTFWLDFVISPVITAGQVTGLCITGNDITEKKKTEREREFDQRNLESLINNTADQMWSVDRDFRLITFNKPFEKSIKATSGIKIKNGSSILLEKFDEKTTQYYRNLYERAFNGEVFTEVQYSESPQPLWYEVSFHPIYRNNEIIGTACFSRDITEDKKNVREKEALIRELSQNNKDLQQFAYITAHNLRGPIANLLGLTNLIDSYKIKGKGLNQILDGIKKASLNFDETIRDLSSILTIKDKPHVQKERLSLIASLNKATCQCASLIEASGAIITADFSQAEEVSFNKSYLESIFLNLLSNSLKYRDYERPLKINIITRVSGNFIILEFSDNGIGFDAEVHKEKIFKLYQRFHDEREGKGLGLFLIKSQLETLGGNISIQSRVNEGATLTISFKDKD